MEDKCRLQIEQRPGLTRLVCVPDGFRAWLVDGASEHETERAIRETADAHLRRTQLPAKAHTD